jgi:hypothetical protein
MDNLKNAILGNKEGKTQFLTRGPNQYEKTYENLKYPNEAIEEKDVADETLLKEVQPIGNLLYDLAEDGNCIILHYIILDIIIAQHF